MSEDLIITEEELNSLLNNLDLKFIAQKLKIENVDKSIITLIKIVKSLQQENKQLKEALLSIKKFLDKHTEIVSETGTKYLITSVKDDNKLINIVNKALGGKE